MCPEPIGVPDTWLDSQPGVASDVPHKEILLRWTSAIRAKAVKLVGSADGSVKGYLQTRVVGPHDAYVIAVNGCQLRNGAISAHLGISHFPVAAEAVFPIGPYQLKIDKDSLTVVERGHQSRPYLKNANAAQVPLYMFLDPRFIPVSAIWAVDLDGSSSIGNAEPTSVIHNPNATSRVSLGYLPADEEYEATSTGSEELTLNKI